MERGGSKAGSRRGGDRDVNTRRAKQRPNGRAEGTDEAVRLPPPRRLSLEQSRAYIQDDELVEVTPRHIRMRKRLLDPNDRKRAARAANVA